MLEEEDDQELLFRLGGDLLGGDRLGGERLGDLLLGDRRSQLGDLTLMERLGDLDLERRGLLPLRLRGGEGVSRMWTSCLFDCSSLEVHLLCSLANVIWRLTVRSRRLIYESVVLSTISSGRGGPKIGHSCSGISA